MTNATLMLVRHGHTVWNETGGVAGRTDVDLSEHGRDSVLQLASTLPEHFSVDHWYCSPLQRTRDTSSLLRQRLSGLPEVQYDKRLVELDFGEWEGMTWSKVHQLYEQQLKQWGEDWVNRAPPNGETFAQQAERCEQWLRAWFAPDGADQTVLAVAHGGTIRAMVCLCLQWPLTDAMRFKVDPASITILRHDQSASRWRLGMLNSQHL